MMREGKMVLTATKQRVIATFPNRQGREQTLYEIEAVNENGEPIVEPLRSFTELPLGKAVEYDVERYEHQRHGVSWTLKKPRENLGRRVAELEGRVQDLADRLSALEGTKRDNDDLARAGLANLTD